ncbi:thiamine diphosphokinase [Priestia megaterium]|nr:thiamine diphosphokinase [Priestia megaterium]
MIIHILAGGPDEQVPTLVNQWKDAEWIGVDRGVFSLLQQNITPRKAFGDFDSITEEQLEYVRKQLGDIELYPAEKDATDLELAFQWAIKQNPQMIRLFGATGGRLDHMFGTLQLLYRGLSAEIEVQMIDKQNSIQLFSAGAYTVEASKYRYVSFIPYSQDVEGLTLEGFKYPLTNHQVELGSTLCISNELIQQRGTFSFNKGILMMVRSNDEGCL